MSQDPSASEPPNSQSTEGETSVPTPTSKWRIFSRGINKDASTPLLFSHRQNMNRNSQGDWNCTHKFEDGTQTYHYINKCGLVQSQFRVRLTDAADLSEVELIT